MPPADVRPTGRLWAVFSLLALGFVTLSTAGFTGLPLSNTAVWAASAAAFGFTWAFVSVPRVCVGTVAAVSIASAAVLWRLPELRESALDFVLPVAQELSAALSAVWSGAPWELPPVPAAIVVAVSCVPVSWLLIRLAVRRRDFWPAVIAGNVVLAWQWMFWFDPAYLLAIGFNVSALSAAATVHGNWRDEKWLRAGRRPKDTQPAHAVGAILVSAVLITAVAIILPYRFTPINWKTVGERLSDHPLIAGMRGQTRGDQPYEYTLSRTGGREAPLGGPSSRTSEDVLYVELSGEVPPGPLYLRGTARDIYTGHSWRQSPPRWTRHRRDDLAEPEISGLDTAGISQEIVILLGRTTQLFAAHEPVAANVAGNRYFRDDQGSLRARTAIEEGGRYSVVSVVPVVDIDRLRQTPIPGSDPELERYLQLPQNLPLRVRELAEEIARRAPSDHTVDIAVTIEHYLRGISYELDMPHTPAGRDFVDYFLFDLGRGYCSYHSTALAVLLRAVGIPTRWAEGFVIHWPAAGGSNVVRGLDAHSWVEVYFEGPGWIPFEATPGYRTAHLPPPGTEQPTVHPDHRRFGFGSDDGWFDDFFLDDFDRWGHSPPTLPVIDDPESEPRPPVALAVVLAALGGATLWAVSSMARRELLPSGPPAAVVTACMAGCFDLLRRFGHHRVSHQTALEYVESLSPVLPETVFGSLRELCRLYYGVRFGGRSGDHNGAAAAIAARSAVAAHLREKWGGLGFLLRRLF